MSAAQMCRDNGWGPGTRLAGDEGYGVTVIEITAVGASAVLAITVSHDGTSYSNPHESTWSLEYRDWREVSR